MLVEITKINKEEVTVVTSLECTDMKSVYVMKSGDKYKIGVSSNPKEREKTLKIGNCDLCLLFESQMFSNSFAVEKMLHDLFKGNSLGREWFIIKGTEKEFLDIVENVCYEFGCVNVNSRPRITIPLVKDNGITYELDEWLEKVERDTQRMKEENEEIQKFTYTLHGYYVPNIYTNCIYKVVFGMNANQLREKYGLGKKDNIRDCFTEEELKAVQSMECLVSGLVDCGWGYDQIKEFIQQTNVKKIAA
ncbi:MAG: GIY-YIG nuclease family protein [Acetivibrio ethanolgignens]